MSNSNEIIERLDLILEQVNLIGKSINNNLINGSLNIIDGIYNSVQNSTYLKESDNFWQSDEESLRIANQKALKTSVLVGVPIITAAGFIKIFNSVSNTNEIMNSLIEFRYTLNMNNKFAKEEALPILENYIQHNLNILIQNNIFNFKIKDKFKDLDFIDNIMFNYLNTIRKIIQIKYLSILTNDINEICNQYESYKNTNTSSELKGFWSKVRNFIDDAFFNFLENPKDKLNTIIKNYYDSVETEYLSSIYIELINRPEHKFWLNNQDDLMSMPLLIGRLSFIYDYLDPEQKIYIFYDNLIEKTNLAFFIHESIRKSIDDKGNLNWSIYVKNLEYKINLFPNFRIYNDQLTYHINLPLNLKDKMDFFQHVRNDSFEYLNEFINMVFMMGPIIGKLYISSIIIRELAKLIDESDVFQISCEGILLLLTSFYGNEELDYKSAIFDRYSSQLIYNLYNKKEGWTIDKAEKFLNYAIIFFKGTELEEYSINFKEYLINIESDLIYAEQKMRSWFGKTEGRRHYSSIYEFVPQELKVCISAILM